MTDNGGATKKVRGELGKIALAGRQRRGQGIKQCMTKLIVFLGKLER
jgi:hypothetical protein